MTLAVVHTGSVVINGLIDGFLFIPLAIWDLITSDNDRLIEHGAWPGYYYYPAWFAGLLIMFYLLQSVFLDAVSLAWLLAVIAVVVLLSILIYGF